MRYATAVGLVALAGSFAWPLAGPRVAAAQTAAPAACTGPFDQEQTPSPGPLDDVLFATAAAGANNIWAVGRQSPTSAVYQNLILFNRGHGWSQVAAPDPGPDYSTLSSVSASGPADAWAAGAYQTGNPDRPVAPEALHWDGSSWISVPLPKLPGELDTDNGPAIADISPADAWLVGDYFSSGADVSFIAHWDGTAWSLASHPASAIAFTAAAASGPDDVWAAGVGAGPSYPAVIEHYNGSAWTTSTTLPGIRLAGITTIGPARAWAVGTSSDGIATATVKWNGSAWKIVPSPNTGSQDGLSAVSAVAGGGVWAVGSQTDFSTGTGESQPMAMHWDGTAWTVVRATGTVADVYGGSGTFFGVVAATPSRVLAVGFGTSQAESLVAHLCAFTVQDSGFTRASAKVSGPGASAYWVIPASDTASHELADGSGLGMFDSGPKAPGSSYAFAFPASGTWLVTDTSDGAHEKVIVPVLTPPGRHGRPELWFASAPPPAGAHFEIRVIPPGGTKFVHFATTVKQAWQLSRNLPAGTYRFKSRLRDPATGASTGWSPTATVALH